MHYEVVRSDAAQPWHARRMVNGRKTWTTEQYRGKRAAQDAIVSIAREMSPTGQVWLCNVNAGGVRSTEIRYNASTTPGTWATATRIEVREIDERYVAPPVVLTPPFFVGEWTEFQGEGRAKTAVRVPFWHDHEYHWRFCAEPCEEGTPPEGSDVRSRMGIAKYAGADHA